MESRITFGWNFGVGWCCALWVLLYSVLLLRVAMRRQCKMAPCTATAPCDSTTTAVLYSPVNETDRRQAICSSGVRVGIELIVVRRWHPLLWTRTVIDLTAAQLSPLNEMKGREPHLSSLADWTHPLTRPPTELPPWDRKSSWSRKWRSMTRNRAPGGCLSYSVYWWWFWACSTSSGAGSFTITVASGPVLSYVLSVLVCILQHVSTKLRNVKATFVSKLFYENVVFGKSAQYFTQL